MMEKDDLISRAALLKECAECQKTDPHFEERGWANHFINDAGEPSTEWYCVEDMIENAPAVDAIPVEWLKERKYRAIVDGDYLAKNIIKWLLEEWQKEQETIEENSNEGKTGTWEPLGHIIGYMNHPYSEYYKCSLCGHEQYTIFDLPPDTCPACRAHLTMEQEGEQ